MLRASLALLLAILLATPSALADEKKEKENALALLRRARVAVKVDRDAMRAQMLYELVWKMAPDTSAGLEAGLALAELYKDRQKRLDLLKDVTARHTGRMSDEQKQKVHQTIARLLEPGQSAKTPLGRVFVRAEAPVRASPVEERIRRIFKAHQVSSLPLRTNTFGARQDIERELRELGEAGRLVLLRFVDHGHPDEAFSAGVVLRYSDPTATVRGYARAIRTGRAQFRAQAVREAGKLLPDPKVSPALVEAFLPLLDVKDIQDVHRSVGAVVVKHMSDVELMARHHSAAKDDLSWLRHALGRHVAEAVVLGTRRALEADPPPWLLSSLQYAVTSSARGAGNKIIYHLDVEKLDKETLAQLFGISMEAYLAKGPPKNWRLWHRLANALRKEQAWDPLRLALWRRSFESDDPEVHKTIGAVLQNCGHGARDLVPEEILRTPADWRRVVTLSLRPGEHYFTAPWMREHVPIWRAAIDRMAKAKDREDRKRVAKRVQELLGTSVPEPLRPECLAYLRAIDHSDGWDGTPSWMWSAAAMTKDPAFLAVIEKNLAVLHQSYGVRQALYGFRKHADVTAFAMRVLDAEPAGLNTWALESLLGKHEDPKVWAKIVSVARGPNAATVLASRLSAGDPKQRALLLELFAWAREHAYTDRKFQSVRTVLIGCAMRLNLREAVPFLLGVYEAPRNDEERQSAMAAMDAIRDHHERLAFFASWGADESGERKVLEMIEDEDPAIRRAAVMSLAALQGPRALPRLLDVAKSDKVEAVRQAALEAIERVATGEGERAKAAGE